MDISFLIGELVKAGLTQAQIASAIGCKQPAISMMASGKVGKARPSFKIVDGLRRLAEEKGVPLNPEPAAEQMGS